MQRADGGVISWLLLFTSTPQSNLRFASSPSGEPFWITTNQNLSPRAGDSSRARPVGDEARGESGGIGSIASGSAARRPYSNQRSCRGVAVMKGERLKAAKCRDMFHLSHGLRRASSSGEPFWCALQTPAQLRRAANDGPYSAHYKPLAKTRGRTASLSSL